MPTPPPPAPQRLFVLAGMPRAGTTFVYHAFAKHPSAFVPYRKELRYFSLNYQRGARWYARFFASAAPDAVCVDASPDYFMDTAAPARLGDFPGRLNVALAVRDPADWAVSLHRQLARHEGSAPRFSEFLASGTYAHFDLSRFRRNAELRFSIKNGFVRNQLAAFREALGERLFLYDFSWFERDPLAAMKALELFLGMKPCFSKDRLPQERINARTRRTMGWLGYLSSRDIVVNAAGLLLPRRWLISMRMRMDRAEASGSDSQPDALDQQNLVLAKSALAPDRAYVKALFSEAPIVLGDGRPFDFSAT